MLLLCPPAVKLLLDHNVKQFCAYTLILLAVISLLGMQNLMSSIATAQNDSLSVDTDQKGLQFHV